ncbi:MAG: GGDEF domain-containing protein [Woeseiaceae bacterium]
MATEPGDISPDMPEAPPVIFADKSLESDKATYDDAAASIDNRDGAIDTLVSIIRAMGDLSFPISDEADTDLFNGLCEKFARHVENGSAVASHGIAQDPGGLRQWANVRRFYIDRRGNEQAFVNDRIGNYRDIVQDLVAGLKTMGQRDQDTETGVREHLGAVEQAVASGDLDEIRSVVSDTIYNVADIFAQQKTDYESQINELNARMSCLREDLVQAKEEMQRDALTQAYNRGAFDGAITRALNMHFILDQPVTIVMIDLDEFKTINDNHGHAAGDEVLRKVGESLARSFIRKGDFVARYGGDEFAVILSDTSAKHAQPLLDRFMQAVASIQIDTINTDHPIKIGCSIGFTEIHENDSATSAINRADSALYDAKNAGRNQYRFATHEKAST